MVNSSDAIISDEALKALLDRNIQPVKEREGGEGDLRQHDGVFKVIHEQDSSGSTLAIGCSNTPNDSAQLSDSTTADSSKAASECSLNRGPTTQEDTDVVGSSTVVADIKV